MYNIFMAATTPAPFSYNQQVKDAFYKDWTGSEQQDWNEHGAEKYYSYLKQGGTPFGDTTASRLAIDAKAQGELAAEKRQAALKPAIQSLTDTKPEIQNLYATERGRLEGEKQPLEERYQTLLDEIKGRESTETNRQTLTTNNELAKRGISNDSGAYQQEMTNVLNPITSKYGNVIKQTNLDREAGLKDISDAIGALTGKESADLRSITQKIADLQSGAANQGVNDYLSLAQQAMQQDFQNRQLDETIRQNNIAEALRRLELDGGSGLSGANRYATLGEGQTLYDLLNGSPLYTAPKTYKSTSGALNGNDPLNLDL